MKTHCENQHKSMQKRNVLVYFYMVMMVVVMIVIALLLGLLQLMCVISMRVSVRMFRTKGNLMWL